MFPQLWTTLLLFLSTINAVRLHGRVRGVANPSASVVYLNGEISALVTTSGKFWVDLPSNDTFIAECTHPSYIFPFKNIYTDEFGVFQSSSLTRTPIVQLVFSPITSIDFDEPALHDTIISYLKKPLVIFVLIIIFANIGLKLMTRNMSAEERQELMGNTQGLDPNNPLSLFQALRSTPQQVEESGADAED
ncbi:hypothetical protein P9112_014414 [Eukaryota sp. TZLM1-RC]